MDCLRRDSKAWWDILGVVTRHALVLAALLGILPGRVLWAAAPAGATTCESLAALSLPHTTITLAKSVPAGEFTPPPPPNPPRGYSPTPLKNLPGFCRVAATAGPSSDSVIKFEVWMPAANWNGKFQGVGNGGWAGNISYGALGVALQHHYATASTDTGHEGGGGDGSFAFGHPEKLVDFAERSVHEMTVQTKALIAAYYGAAPQYSYWNGCSSGGRQGLVEAQRYPHDYNGIAAGAPANYWTHLSFGTLWPAKADLIDPASYIPPNKYELIHQAALAACDALDGVADQLINDPTRCHFDPGVLTCKGAEAADCLTVPQVKAARMIYAGPKNPRTGKQIFPGLEPGSESGWKPEAGGPQPFPIGQSYFQYVLFKNPQWDFRDLNYDQDVALADQADHGLLNAINPDLKAFRDSGGKLLLYHGWIDNLIAPGNSVNYFESVLTTLGGRKQAENFFRLFMVPGMGHCGGGPGPSLFDRVGVIERWVEQGEPPDRIVAARNNKDLPPMTRPLCPYPEVAKWKGSGTTSDAANFVCVMEDQQPIRVTPGKGGTPGGK
jgi:feruloyl esterase